MSTKLEDYGEVLTPNEAKEVLSVGRNTIYKLLKLGEIKSLRIGKKILIPKTSIVEYINGVV